MRTIPVAAGIILQGPHLLAAKRPAGKAGAGYWEFPGGKRENGETMAETLCRELREEIGLEIRPESVHPWKVLTHEAFGQRVELHFMLVTAFHGEPTPREGQELRWVTFEEAEKLPFLPVDVDVLRDLRTAFEKRNTP